MFQSGATIYEESFNDGLRPDPDMTITEWADLYRYLPKKSSSEPGKYRSSRTPYLCEIMDVLSPSNPIQEITVMKGTQLGFTEVANNFFGFVADMCPGPMMMIFPTVELAKGHSQQKLTPTIEETPRLRGKIAENKSRDSGNTILSKDFPGGSLFLSGSNSAAAMRSKSIRFLVEDDLDGFEHNVGDEGDPGELGEKRTDTYGSRKKIYRISSPTIKSISRISKHFNNSNQSYYHVPCPHCSEKQRLEFGDGNLDYGIKFKRNLDGEVIKAWYICRSCHNPIEEHSKTWMLANGEWIPEHPDRKKRGYHLSSLYSPIGWVSWIQIAQEFINAKTNRELLRVWINTRLGMPFEEKGDQPDWVQLRARCEPYKMMTVPAGGIILTASVDVQDDRLEAKIKAWGYGEESWLIYYGKIFGNTEDRPVWDQLDILLNRSFQHVNGHELRIASMAIDSGHRTQIVYNYCRFRSPRVIAIKGSSNPSKPVIGKPTSQDVSYRGTTIKEGIQLWPIGTNTAKSTIYGRLYQSEPGPGYMHFPEGIEDDYFMQLTAEKLVTKFDNKGFMKTEWVKIHTRNEALDLEVYCYAAAIRAGIAYMDFIKPAATGSNKSTKSSSKYDQRNIYDVHDRLKYQRPDWLDR